MRLWGGALLVFVGLVLGGALVVIGPPLADPYLPEALKGKREVVEGEVTRKQREPDRLLITVVTERGAILATFKEKLAEVDLLIAEGDAVTLSLRRFEPFVEDPVIQSVRKKISEATRGRSRSGNENPGPISARCQASMQSREAIRSSGSSGVTIGRRRFLVHPGRRADGRGALGRRVRQVARRLPERPSDSGPGPGRAPRDGRHLLPAVQCPSRTADLQASRDPTGAAVGEGPRYARGLAARRRPGP